MRVSPAASALVVLVGCGLDEPSSDSAGGSDELSALEERVAALEGGEPSTVDLTDILARLDALETANTALEGKLEDLQAELELCATEAWVGDQGFLTSDALTGYATTADVGTALADYALTTDVMAWDADVQAWVVAQGYATESYADAGDAEAEAYADAADQELSDRVTSIEDAGYATSESVSEAIALTDVLSLGADESGYESLYVTGVNVYVRNGEGTTASTNGVGNLIVGYNELQEDDERVGSHNLVLGVTNTYRSYGALVAGYNATSSAEGASVLGGSNNLASGAWSAAIGGDSNQASAAGASTLGGTYIFASGTYAVAVGGGNVDGVSNNNAAGYLSTVVGGYANGAGGDYSVIAGGFNGSAPGSYSVVVGGERGFAYGQGSLVAGGYNNQIDSAASYAAIVGGETGTAVGEYSIVVGGLDNRTDAENSVVVGGLSNYTQAGAVASVLSGGYLNVSHGNYATVTGGAFSDAYGDFSLVAGGEEGLAQGSYTAVFGGQSNVTRAVDAHSVIVGGYDYTTNVAYDIGPGAW